MTTEVEPTAAMIDAFEFAAGECAERQQAHR